MSTAAGETIYKAFVPSIKMMLCIAIGFIITKRGMFPPSSAKGVSTLSLNIGLPSLVFSSMVTAFTPQNISAFGSLVFVALLYEVLGLLLALITRDLFYVPPDFQWGILVMGFVSNWGNLPIATVQVLAADSPFNPSTDVELGVAYISVAILIMNTCLFPLGLHKLCALDFKEENLSKERLPLKQRWAARLVTLRRHLHGVKRREDMSALEESNSSFTAVNDISITAPAVRSGDNDMRSGIEQDEPGEDLAELKQRFVGGAAPTRKTSRTPSFTSMLNSTRNIPSTAPLDATDITNPCDLSSSTPSRDPNALLPVCSTHGNTYSFHQPLSPVPSVHKLPFLKQLSTFLRGMIMPVSVAVIVGIPCSIVLPLKSLFIETSGWTGTRMPNAPDGKPPLSFILVTASFLGAMTVPATLILLGASFARLKMPASWRELPIAAIISMTVCKMIIVPLIGIFVVQALRDTTGLYPPADKIRIFVAILISGTPAAVNQLVLTQLYNPSGTAHTLAMFLMLQYLCMPILSTTLSAIALYIVERG